MDLHSSSPYCSRVKCTAFPRLLPLVHPVCQIDLVAPSSTTLTLLFKYFPCSQCLQDQRQIPPPGIQSTVTQSICQICFSFPVITLRAPWASCPTLSQLHGSVHGFFFFFKGMPSTFTSLEVQPKCCLFRRSLNPEEVTTPSSECPLFTLVMFIICNQTTNPGGGGQEILILSSHTRYGL